MTFIKSQQGRADATICPRQPEGRWVLDFPLLRSASACSKRKPALPLSATSGFGLYMNERLVSANVEVPLNVRLWVGAASTKLISAS